MASGSTGGRLLPFGVQGLGFRGLGFRVQGSGTAFFLEAYKGASQSSKASRVKVTRFESQVQNPLQAFEKRSNELACPLELQGRSSLYGCPDGSSDYGLWGAGGLAKLNFAVSPPGCFPETLILRSPKTLNP